MAPPVNYTPSSSFWTSITNLVDTTLVTAELLYKQGINRAADRTEWLRDELVRQQARLATVDAGTKATIVGSVNLSTLTYDATSGSLNGKTMSLQTDTGATPIVTFGTGGLAPMSPADVAAQINAATTFDPAAVVDAAGHLNLSSPTTGASSTVESVSGSALAVVGLSVAQDATGLASGADGAAQIGVAAITGTSFNLAAGTLRAALTSIATGIGSASTLTNDGTAADASPTTLTISAVRPGLRIIPDVSGTTVYTLADGTTLGQTARFTRLTNTTGHSVTFKRVDTTTIAVFGGSAVTWVDVVWANLGGGAKWHPSAWGPSVTV